MQENLSAQYPRPDIEFDRPPHGLLPTREQLQPITDPRSTFGETYFNKPYDELEFGDKLKVVADILRQSVLPEYYSDPTSEEATLTGDCHATSRLAAKYLKYLGVGETHDYAMVNRRPFDPEEKSYSKHAIAIVTDSDGKRWQLDSAPWMGYGYGSVCQEGASGQIIDDYTVINEEAMFIIDRIKDLRILARTRHVLSDQEKDTYAEILKEGERYPHLVGFVGEGYAALALQSEGRLQQEFANKAILLDPYRGANADIASFASDPEPFLVARSRLQEYTERQCKVWEEELNDLLGSGRDNDLERKLQLAQWIVNERKFADPSLAKLISVNGRMLPLTAITPRLLSEMQLNTAIIKPSAEFIGARSTVREQLRKQGIAAEYSMDPTNPTELTGITPLLFSHALAAEFERSYTGKNTVSLVSSNSERLLAIKKDLRRTIGNRVVGTQILWTDNRPIEWHPFSMNYLHTSDNPQEAALHFMFGFPEYAVMNRWMYPNPALK